MSEPGAVVVKVLPRSGHQPALLAGAPLALSLTGWCSSAFADQHRLVLITSSPRHTCICRRPGCAQQQERCFAGMRSALQGSAR